MTTCPKCQTDNRAGAQFCRLCGCNLGTESPLSEPHPGQLHCPICGAALRTGSRFCSGCGQSLPDSTGAPSDVAVVLCTSCGESLRPGALFCRTCGARAEAVDADATTSEAAGPDAATSAPSPQEPTPQSTITDFGTGTLVPMQILAERYMVLEKIAQGGMGAIYKAQDKRLGDKVVVLKEMSLDLISPSERDDVLEAFTREARLLSRLDHPFLVKVTDYLEDRGRHYMVMAFVAGETLQAAIDARLDPFPESQVLKWAEQLCNVLSFLHHQLPPIVYRDLKPGNIMIELETGDIKLIDFGIARFYKPGKSQDTIQFGTDGYAPPEQYGKTQTDERADVYALGATLHQLLSCQDPGDRLFQFSALREQNASVSRRTADVIARMVKPDRDKRPASMADAWAALCGQAPTWTHLSAPRAEQPVHPSAGGSVKVGPETRDLSFGRVPSGARKGPVSCRLIVPPGGRTALVPAAPWLDVRPVELDEGGGEALVEIDTGALSAGRLQLRGGLLKRWVGWHTCRLVPAQREYRSHILMKPESGLEQQLRVSLVLVPTALQVGFGWAVTVLLILTEVGLPVGAVFAWLLGSAAF